MDAKTLEIVKAGWAMFARYGYGKTTMSDIAAEAGVARQTVYNAFASKEDILRAVVRHAGDTSLVDVQSAWKNAEGLDAKVSIFQSLGPEAWYEAMRAAPDWAALLDGMNAAAADELKQWEVDWSAALSAMFADELGTKRADFDEVAAFLFSASKNAKYGAADAADLKRRLATIRRAALALLQ
ncbi:MAG: TetR/AcrR family transcriptional regulator [Paracoccaceae bacterium]